jgi:hypothetical protein
MMESAARVGGADQNEFLGLVPEKTIRLASNHALPIATMQCSHAFLRAVLGGRDRRIHVYVHGVYIYGHLVWCNRKFVNMIGPARYWLGDTDQLIERIETALGWLVFRSPIRTAWDKARLKKSS